MGDTMRRAAPGAGAGWGWTMALGVISLVLGIAALIEPFVATYTATLLLGTLLIATGVVAIGAAVVGRGHGRETYLLLYGILSLAIGLSMAFFPLSGAITLTLLVAIWLGVRGVLEIVAGRRVTRHRGALIALGVVNVVLAIVIVATIPYSALTLPGYLLGFSLILGGIAEIMAARAHRSGAPAFG